MEYFKKIVTWPLLLLIYGYRYLISPLLPARCRFYPTCSQYAVEALKTQNCGKAIWLILKRLLKCHPWHDGGFDPVPQKDHSN